MDPQAVQQVATTSPWWVGALITVIAALATTVGFLFRRLDQRNTETESRLAAKDEAIAAERVRWATEHARLVGEHKLQLQTFEHRISEERALAHKHEAAVRKECNDLMERMAQEAQKAALAQVEILQKFYDRFVGGSRIGRDRR